MTEPYYEAVHYPGAFSDFCAITEDGKRHTITTAWTICEARKYALAGGFTHEQYRREDGLAMFSWRKPVTP